MIVQQGMNNTKGTAPPPPCLHWQVSLTWTILGCERELEMAASMMAILSRCKPLGRAGWAGGTVSGAQVVSFVVDLHSWASLSTEGHTHAPSQKSPCVAEGTSA